MSELQNNAKDRNYFKMRLMGVKSIFSISNRNITKQERIYCDEIIKNIDLLIDNFTESSRELGFKASYRCHFCGKKATSDYIYNNRKRYVCDIHLGGY